MIAATKWFSNEKPLRMIAHGHKALGSVVLKNESDERLKIGNIAVENTTLRSKDGQLLSHVQVSRRIDPGEEVTARIRMDIDPTMPPGTYEGHLKYESVVDEPFFVHIPERSKLALLPKSVLCDGKSGEKASLDVMIENRGNVPVTIDKEKTMLLAEEQEIFKTFGSAVRHFSTEGNTKVLDELAKNLRDATVRPMLVKFENNDLTIQPGETRLYSVSMKFPASLKSKRYYYGYIFVGGATFNATIHCTDNRKD